MRKLLVLLIAICLLTFSFPATTSASSVVWFSWSPRVVALGGAGSLTLTANISGPPALVQVQLAGGGGALVMANMGSGIYQVTMSQAQAISSYSLGQGHALVGYLQIYDAPPPSPPTLQVNLTINVSDDLVPSVSVQPLAADAQASPHVVNIRYDTLYLGGPVPPVVLQRFYQLYPDNFYFVNVIEQVGSIHNRFNQTVRNDVSGIGMPIFNNDATYGSSGRLHSIISFPNDGFFDLAETGSLHEFSHQWINHSSYAPLSVGIPHWPIGDIAYGIIGFSLPGGQGGTFPFDITSLGDGTYQLHVLPFAVDFNDLELYFMGLIPSNQVAPHFAFQNQDQLSQLHDGGILQGPITNFTINDIMGSDGTRSPTYLTSPKKFRVASIVLSQGGLLSPLEMSFFDAEAARGEATTPLPFRSGLLTGTTHPFFLATSRLASLITSLSDPVLNSFAINGGAATTTSQNVTLNNTASNSPTEYLASESSSFTGAAWLPYAAAPGFTLSTGLGTKTVYMKVRDSAGESSVLSDTINVVGPPVPPTWASATPLSSTQVQLQWNDNSSDEQGFVIYRYGAGASATAGTAGPNATSFTDNGVTPGVHYIYSLIAYNANGWSLAPNTITAITPGGAPTPPVLESATGISTSQITLTWQDNSSNELGFQVYRWDPVLGWIGLGLTAPNATYFTDSGLNPGATYTYWLVANNGLFSGFSPILLSGTTFSAAPDPAAPLFTGGTTVSASQIGLNWSDNTTDETEYRVWRWNGASWVQIATLPANSTTYTDSLLATGTAYRYQVSAFKSGTYEKFTPVAVSVTTAGAWPTPPTLTSAIGLSQTSIRVNWQDNSSNETGFKLIRTDSVTGVSTLVDLPAGTTTYLDAGLVAGRYYFYWVWALGAQGNGYAATIIPANTFSP